MVFGRGDGYCRDEGRIRLVGRETMAVGRRGGLCL